MILWVPVILIRPFVAWRKVWALDILLLCIGITCIINSDSKFELIACWWYLPFYFFIAVVVYLGSVLLTVRHPLLYLQKTFQSILQPTVNIHKKAAWVALKTSVVEELVWRVVFQTVLISAVGLPIGILITAVSFSLLHRHRTSGLTIKFAEIFLFSLLLGALFALTRDLAAIITIHAIRNYLIGIRGTINL